MRRALMSGLAAALGACSVLEDFSGLSGGEQATVTGDARADTSIVDGGGTTDGTTRPPDGEAGPAAFCQPGAHAFCSDFDKGTLLDVWTEKREEFGGRVELSTARSLSPSGSLFTTLPRRGDINTTYYSFIRKEFPGNWRRMVASFDVYVENQVWQVGDVNSGIASFGFVAQNVQVYGAISLGRDYVSIGFSDHPGKNGKALPRDAWVHFACEVDPATLVRCVIDGETLDIPITNPATPGAAQRMAFDLGIAGYNDPAPEYRVHYDNVTVDFP
jgi:hypothetical protein